MKKYLDIKFTLNKTFALIGMLLFSAGVFAQSISGNVSSEDGPLPGATVVVKGTENGTSTDFDGNFTINASDGDVLIVSFIGFETQEVAVSGDQVDVVLAEGNELNEVVVTGYGTELRRNITGSVAVIDSEVIENRNLTSVGQALAGTAPGVQVTQGSGEPGGDRLFISIRGVGTLNNGAPLVIVDGIEGNLNNLNPQDIESISVLKDAASASIYGSRAANGVIVVKTKRGGKNVPTKFTYDASFATSKLLFDFDQISFDPIENVTWKNQVDVGNGATGRWSADDIAFINANKSNWLGSNGQTPEDVYLQDATLQQHTFAASGGSEKTNYRISAGLLDQTGNTQDGSKFKRANFRINLDSQINDKLSIGTTISMVRGERNSRGEVQKDGLNNPIHTVTRIHNIFSPTRNANGDLEIASSDLVNYGVGPGTGLYAIETWKDYKDAQSITNNVLANAFVAFSPVEGLTFKGTAAVNYRGTSLYDFQKNPKNYFADGTFYNSFPATVSTRANTEFYTETYFATANYEKSFGDLNFKALAGYQQEENRVTNFRASRDGYLSETVQVLDSGAQDNQQNFGSESGFSVQSVFARFDFEYKNKFLLQANVRSDGSSRFKNDKWGSFPSFSAGWILSEEDFIPDTFEFLKLRASYGELGNANIGNFEFAQRLSLSEAYNFSNAAGVGSIAPGVGQTTIGNPNLSWEKAKITNIGFNSILSNGLGIDFEYFIRETNDILFDIPINVLTGFTSQTSNAAKMENKGWELGLRYNKTFGDLKVQLSGQLSKVENTVKDLNPKVDGGDLDRLLFGSRIIGEGLPFNGFYLVKTDGLITGTPNAANASLGAQTGDINMIDLDGDNEIGLDDRQYVGKDIPTYTYGFQLGLQYKGFDLAAIFQGEADVQYYGDFELWRPDSGGILTWKKWITESVTNNPSGTFPRAGSTTSSYRFQSDFFLYDRDYLRLKNLQIGYNIPTDSLPIDGLRLFFNATNLLTFTNLPLVDPEQRSGAATTADPALGEQGWADRPNATYPNSRTISFGLSAKF
ncbi:MAG: hypothetical protein CMC48_04735 [Flavobacteriaceae bacterium]|nr:hypothetical protein [Flavobacteriaceae bacterium]